MRNKDPLNDADANLEIAGFQPNSTAMLYHYGQESIEEGACITSLSSSNRRWAT